MWFRIWNNLVLKLVTTGNLLLPCESFVVAVGEKE